MNSDLATIPENQADGFAVVGRQKARPGGPVLSRVRGERCQVRPVVSSVRNVSEDV